MSFTDAAASFSEAVTLLQKALSDMVIEKKCIRCDEVKPETEFPIISQKRGRRKVCKICHKAHVGHTPAERAERARASRARLAELFKNGIGPIT